jgi:hypothetical protein
MPKWLEVILAIFLVMALADLIQRWGHLLGWW